MDLVSTMHSLVIVIVVRHQLIQVGTEAEQESIARSLEVRCVLIKTKRITTLISLELQRLPLQLAMDMSVLVSRSTLKVVECFRIMPCLYKIPSFGVCMPGCMCLDSSAAQVSYRTYSI